MNELYKMILKLFKNMKGKINFFEIFKQNVKNNVSLVYDVRICPLETISNAWMRGKDPRTIFLSFGAF